MDSPNLDWNFDNFITGNGTYFLPDKTFSEKCTKSLQIPDDGRSRRDLCPDTGVFSANLDWNFYFDNFISGNGYQQKYQTVDNNKTVSEKYPQT